MRSNAMFSFQAPVKITAGSHLKEQLFCILKAASSSLPRPELKITADLTRLDLETYAG